MAFEQIAPEPTRTIRVFLIVGDNQYEPYADFHNEDAFANWYHGTCGHRDALAGYKLWNHLQPGQWKLQGRFRYERHL